MGDAVRRALSQVVEDGELPRADNFVGIDFCC